MGLVLNDWNKFCVEHKLKIFSCFILQHKCTGNEAVRCFKAFTRLEEGLNGTTDDINFITVNRLNHPLSQPQCVYNHTILTQTSQKMFLNKVVEAEWWVDRGIVRL